MRRRVQQEWTGICGAVASIVLLGAGCGASADPPVSASAPTTESTATAGTAATPAPSGGGVSSPAPSASTATALASKTFTVTSTYSRTRLPMRLDIVEPKRRGDLLDVKAELRNLEPDQSQDQRWQIAGRFSGSDYRKDLSTTSGAFSGVVLTDRVGKKRYFVAADSARACVCTVNLSGTFIDAGETVELEATYAAPPTSTSVLDVAVPTLGVFRDLPIS